MTITDTAPVDVNAAFAAERASQLSDARDRAARTEADIASGKLVPLGGDRYRINDSGSWDNGEVVTRRQGKLVPETGLDLSTGNAAIYSAVPTWHGLNEAGVIPGGTSDIDKVLELGHIGYEVEKVPALFRAEHDGPTLVVPEQYVTVRKDTGAALGVVGSRYEVFQNRQVFEFLQELVDDFGVTWESAGALRGGRRVFVSLRLPGNVVVDAKGVNDEIIPFIMAVNSHDGNGSAQVVVTPWRPVCGNTERFGLRDAHSRWGVRHTKNGLSGDQRKQEARRSLGLAVKYFDEFRSEEEELAAYELELGEWQKVQDSLWTPPKDDASKRTETIHKNRAAVLDELWKGNSAKLGATAYAAERTITEWADWRTTIKPSGVLKGNKLEARITAAVEGDRDKVKTAAHKQLLTLARR